METASEDETRLTELFIQINTLYSLAENTDIPALQEATSSYQNNVERFFKEFKKDEMTRVELDRLEQFVALHKKLTEFISGQKERISENIKTLKTGKTMQKTYPQLFY